MHTEKVTGIDHPAFQETSCSPEKKEGKMDLKQNKEKKKVKQKEKKPLLFNMKSKTIYLQQNKNPYIFSNYTSK